MFDILVVNKNLESDFLLSFLGLLDNVTVLIGIAYEGKAIAGIINQPYYNYQVLLPTTQTVRCTITGSSEARCHPVPLSSHPFAQAATWGQASRGTDSQAAVHLLNFLKVLGPGI